MDRDVHPGLPGHTRISPGSDSGEPACPVHNIGPMPFLQTERLIARLAAAGERLSGSFAGHVSLQGTTRKCSRCFRASCISGLVEQSQSRLFIRHSAVMLFGHPGFSQPSYIFLVGSDIFAQGDDTGFGSGLQHFSGKTVSKAFDNPGPEAARPSRWAA